MNWEKIKMIVIWILIGMNLVLFGFNYKVNQKYVLSAEREKAIYSVLARSNVGMYTEMVPRFDDMRRISVEIPDFSRENLTQMFFPGEEVEYYVEDDWNVIMGETGQVSTKNENFEFVSFSGTGSIENLTADTAEEAAESFVATYPVFENIVLRSVENDGNRYICRYTGQYKKHRIFCISLTVYVDKNGIEQANGSLFHIQGYYGVNTPICAPDEALMTFVHNMEKTSETKFVTEIDIGYDIQESGDISGLLKLVPCYYIYVQGVSRPVVIDAYTNEIKN